VVETVTKEVMSEKLNSLVTPTTNQTTVAPQPVPQTALPIQQQSAINDMPDQQQPSSSVDAASVSDEAEKKEK
jgi:hypothetical protein